MADNDAGGPKIGRWQPLLYIVENQLQLMD